MNRIPMLFWAVVGTVAWAMTACTSGTLQPEAGRPAGLDRVQHVVVIYMENHSFDNLYGQFPGADGLANAGSAATQTNRDGSPYATLPPALDTHFKPPAPDARFPRDLPNRPFLLDPYVPQSKNVGSIVHRYYQNIEQINGGKNDRFAAVSDAGATAMGYHDTRALELWKYAEKYTLADRFFQAAFGGSFLNHQWLICACTPLYEGAPASQRAQVDGSGRLVKDGNFTPDGYAINTVQPLDPPYHKSATDPAQRLPGLTGTTIGERLSEKGISWAWYSGGWDDAAAGHPDPRFQYHHQPLGYYARYGKGTPGRAQHLKDGNEFEAAIAAGTLPAVSFYKPNGPDNQHPSYTDLVTGDRKVADLLGKIEASPQWPSTVVILTYDENGGYWDHVAPPRGDRWGPGTRIPALIVSPFAKRSFVDHTVYDTTSILAFIELRFGVAPLTERDAQAAPLLGALEFTR